MKIISLTPTSYLERTRKRLDNARQRKRPPPQATSEPESPKETTEPNREDELSEVMDSQVDDYCNDAFLEKVFRDYEEWPYGAKDAAPMSLPGSPSAATHIESSIQYILSRPISCEDENASLLMTADQTGSPAPTECQVFTCPSPCHLSTDDASSSDELSLIAKVESPVQSSDAPASKPSESAPVPTEYQVETYLVPQVPACSSPCHLPTDSESSSDELSLTTDAESPEQSNMLASSSDELDTASSSDELESLDTASSLKQSSDTDASSPKPNSRAKLIPSPSRGLQTKARLVDTGTIPSLPETKVLEPGKTVGKRSLADDNPPCKRQRLELLAVHRNPYTPPQPRYARKKLFPRGHLPQGKAATPGGDAYNTGDEDTSDEDFFDTGDEEGMIFVPYRAHLKWGARELANLRARVEEGDSPSSVAKQLKRSKKQVLACWHQMNGKHLRRDLLRGRQSRLARPG